MQSKSQINFQEFINKNEFDYKEIYITCFPMIRSMILKNSGSLDDAKDVFQDAVLALHQKHGIGNFQLTASISTYIYSVARNMWLKQIRHGGRYTSIDDKFDLPELKQVYEEDIHFLRQRLLVKHLSSLGDKCQQMIKLYFEGMPGEEIAKTLEFSSYEYYRVAKNRCIDNLKFKMKQDFMYNELK